MATYEATEAVSLLAGEDLRTAIYSLLFIEDDANVGKVVKTTGVTVTPIGVLAENPDSDATTDGRYVSVALLKGICKGIAGGAIVAGDLLVPDTTAGRLIGVTGVGALAADSMAVGVALATAIDGDIFSFLAMPIAAPHSV